MTKRFRPHIKALHSLQSGPLGAHLESFASLLIQRGYSSEAGWDKIRLVADLSRWMVQKNVPLEELDEKRTTTFLGWRWKRVAHQTGDQCTVALLLRQLRQEGSVPAPVAPAPNQMGLVITIEPIIAAGSGRAVVAKDGWTIRTADRTASAHYEHTLVITNDEPILLTAA